MAARVYSVKKSCFFFQFNIFTDVEAEINVNSESLKSSSLQNGEDIFSTAFLILLAALLLIKGFIYFNLQEESFDMTPQSPFVGQ